MLMMQGSPITGVPLLMDKWAERRGRTHLVSLLITAVESRSLFKVVNVHPIVEYALHEAASILDSRQPHWPLFEWRLMQFSGQVCYIMCERK